MKNGLTRIIGPCSMQSREVYTKISDYLVSVLGVDGWFYKASFDKANRTSLYGGRGPGLEEGIEIFKEMKERHPSLKLTTDVHETWQVEKLAEVVDLIQIPAFLCRQTDLIVEAARHFDIVNIKKGQWLGPGNLLSSVDKIKNTNPDAEAWITDRGSNFGYDKLINDFTIVDELKSVYDKVILDCTHSTQRERKVYGRQGDPILAARHFIAAPIYNYDGVFAEVHYDPKSSPSDGDCMIKIDKLEDLLGKQEKALQLLGGLNE
jgi:2-dehydro-3-deoxyphosphooctonate aldolase (KDO 8-P synthase)